MLTRYHVTGNRGRKKEQMEAILLEILQGILSGEDLDDRSLEKIIYRYNQGLGNESHFKKRHLLPYYLKARQNDPELWARWGIDGEIEKKLFSVLRMKPRRSASGVATITVITKPWKCSSDCLFCPNDLRMPKSYLHDEPACQRAERNYFDPYLQVVSRLKTLTEMGHATDKIEMIISGGNWTDYPLSYQIWFMKELFSAINNGYQDQVAIDARQRFYQQNGISQSDDELAELVRESQRLVNAGELDYNSGFESIYLSPAWQVVAASQTAELPELIEQQSINETAANRMVGLSVEIRPDLVSARVLKDLRLQGVTKIQMGIQSLDQHILDLNERNIQVEQITHAFELVRLFGYKIQAHFMVNLYGATPEKDKLDYLQFVSDSRFQPDEVKLYPCSLVESARLMREFARATWKPYSEDELVDVLIADTLATPGFIRISRMVRDISADDIVSGNRKTNLRQMVESQIARSGKAIQEIRYREISLSEPDVESLTLELISYETTISEEVFLQWVTVDGKIAGFLRLSLPKDDHAYAGDSDLPVHADEAMIREVHVYGTVARLGQAGESAQHSGLGRRLIERASTIAAERGYVKINVISSIGTREYYRNLGFYDNGLYQQRDLT